MPNEIVGLLARETGCSFGFGMFQMHFVPGLFRQAAATAYAPVGQVIPSDVPGTFAMGLRRPVGVVGAIAPWNAALILGTLDCGAARARQHGRPQAVGVVAGERWADLGGDLRRRGTPRRRAEHRHARAGRGRSIADAFVEHPAVRRINFTGSTNTGRKLAEAAGRNLKRIVLELGGYNPLIVLGDADLEYAINASAFGAFLHQGQICMSARKIIVERSIADEFTERLAAKTKTLKAGDPKEHDTIIGPLISEDALATVKGRVDDAVAKGARVLAGGAAVGPWYQATLVADVPQDSALAQLETFGPVLAIEVVDSAEDAVVRANATAYGLSAGILTKRTRTAASRSRSRSTRGSCTSTTSRSATSRRCRSAA